MEIQHRNQSQLLHRPWWKATDRYCEGGQYIPRAKYQTLGSRDSKLREKTSNPGYPKELWQTPTLDFQKLAAKSEFKISQQLVGKFIQTHIRNGFYQRYSKLADQPTLDDLGYQNWSYLIYVNEFVIFETGELLHKVWEYKKSND